MDYRSLATDISAFKDIVPADEDMDAIVKSMKQGQGNVRASSKSKGKKMAKADATCDSESPDKKLEKLEPFFKAVHWTHEEFSHVYQKIFAALIKPNIERSDRLSADLGLRIMSQCGLFWNPQSQNRTRDWAPLALVITIETAVVKAYRKTLVDECSGARALRQELAAFFLGQATRQHQQSSGKGKTTASFQWEFADMVAGDPSEEFEDSAYNPQELKAEWEHSRVVIKDKKDPIAAIIKNLEKNKYLCCAESKSAGSTKESTDLETLAHQLLTPLMEVCTFSMY